MVRSALFNISFYIVTILVLLLGLPLLLLPQKWTIHVYKIQARCALWLLKHIAKIDIDIRGQENLLKGPLIIASKHQSVWETFALSPYLTYPIVILKNELMWLPLLGWYAFKFGCTTFILCSFKPNVLKYCKSLVPCSHKYTFS